jgi:hypothetical protein
MSNEPKFYAGHDYPTRNGSKGRIEHVRADGAIEGFIGTMRVCWYPGGRLLGPHGNDHPHDLIPVKLGEAPGLFEVGKYYRTRDGKAEVRINTVNRNGLIDGLYVDTNSPGMWYASGRRLLDYEHPNDLLPGALPSPVTGSREVLDPEYATDTFGGPRPKPPHTAAIPTLGPGIPATEPKHENTTDRIAKLEAHLAKFEEEQARENEFMDKYVDGIAVRLDKFDDRLDAHIKTTIETFKRQRASIDRIGERLEAFEDRFSPAPPKSGWINVYARNDEAVAGPTVFKTRLEADQMAGIDESRRIACVEVAEGEGLF